MVRKKGVPRKSLELGTVVTKTSSTPYLPNFVLQGAMVDTTSNHHNALGSAHDRSGHALRSGLEKKGVGGEERHFDEEWKPKRKAANYASNNNTNDNAMDEDEPPPTSRRDANKRDRDGEPKARVALVTGGKRHPLADHINLSDLQVIITEALYHYGEPCSFEKLNDFVSNQIKERDIRRKDGTPYAADCRRAIQANLRITSNSLPALYKKDANGMWSMCYTMEEARRIAAASSEHHEFVDRPVKSSLKLVNSRDREASNNANSEKHATRESNNSRGLGLSFESDEGQNLFDDDAIQGPRTRAQEKTFKSIVQPNHPNGPYREEDQNPLSLLQKFISLYIICNSEKSSIDSMEEEALQYWPKQFHSFARRSIVMCLVNQFPPVLFMRNPEYFTNWQLSESHQWYELSSEEIEKKKPAIYKQLLTAKKSDLTCEDVSHDFSMTLQ